MRAPPRDGVSSAAPTDRPLTGAGMPRGAALALASLFPFMVVVVAPLAFHFGNRDELHFGVAELMPGTLLVFAATTLCLFLVVLLAGRWRTGERLVTGALVGLAAAVWLQTQIFVWDFGPLDGRGIEWSRWAGWMRVELAVWVLLPVLAVLLAGRSARALGQGVALAGVLSVGVSSWMAPQPDRGAWLGEHGAAFRFHPTDNTLIIVLDSFHSAAFDTLLNRHREALGFLDGFTYYRNVVGGFPTTYPSVPYLLTGRMYRNREPIRDFLEHAYAEAGVPLTYEQAGYGVVLTSIIPRTLYWSVQEGGLASMREVVADLHHRPTQPLWVFLDGGLFRAAPTALKHRVYRDGNWLLAYRLGRDHYPPGEHGTDVRFLELFERYAAVGSESAGELRLYHFFVPHIPVRVGETLRYDPQARDSWEGYLRQARGALTLVGRMLATLERLSLYHGAEIVITSDHGEMRYGRWEVFGEAHGDRGGGVTDHVHMAALPLLLHKPRGATGPVEVSDLPLVLGDVPCLLSVSAAHDRCVGQAAQWSVGQRARHFLHYDWKDRDWDRAYLPPMTELTVEGHAWDPTAWSGGGRVFAPTEVLVEEPLGSYRLGEELDMSLGGGGLRHLAGGWSSPEGAGIWTNGQRAHLRFRLSESAPAPGELRLLARPFLGGVEIDQQEVVVYVNGLRAADWRVTEGGWYRASIPLEVAADGEFEVRLELPGAVSPAAVDESSHDHRALALFVQRIALLEAPLEG